jgi:hypothetical protein
MFFKHCIQLLDTGDSSVKAEQVTDLSRIVFRLAAGVQIKRLDSIKTALLMIEAIKLSWQQEEGVQVGEESARMFDNFVTYVYANFQKPIAMALIKYAFKDRALNNRKATKCSKWSVVKESLTPVLLGNKDSVTTRLNSQFERCYRRMGRCHSISECLHRFIKSELALQESNSVLAIDREVLNA